MTAPPPTIFDRDTRRLRRDRSAQGPGSPLQQAVADDLAERLSAVKRIFATALVINSGAGHMAAMLRARDIDVTETDHGAVFAAAASGIHCDEDRLDTRGTLFDLIVMPCGLDTIDDVPGALIAARQALAPGGMFLASLIGAPSLPLLREITRSADAAGETAVARIHPQIDVRGAGDLLVRAGFVLPVADVETLDLSYASLDRLIADIRAAGLGNALVDRRPVSRAWLDAARTAFAALSTPDGRVAESVTILTLTGWAP